MLLLRNDNMRKAKQMSIKSPTSVYYVNRNRFFMMKDFFPRWYPIFLPIYMIFIFPATLALYLLKGRFNLLPSLWNGVQAGLYARDVPVNNPVVPGK